jgi:hypothetical protein
MAAANRFLTTYKPSRQGSFRAAIDLFDRDALRVAIEGQAAVLTAGLASAPEAPRVMLERLGGLAGVTRRRLQKSPEGWVMLLRDNVTHRLVRREFATVGQATTSFAIEIERHEPRTIALVTRSVLELLDQATQEELIGASVPQANAPQTLAASPAEALNRERVLEARAELLAQVPTYTSEQLATLRASTTTNASQLGQDLRKAGKLFGVRHGKGWFYPQLQVDDRGVPYPEVAEVLRALGAEANGWDVLQWFTESNDHLDGRKPLEVWRKDRQRVIKAALHAHWFVRD